jgi:hypothetical protein
MFTESRLGALTVVQQVRDTSWIQKELKALDDRLFLEKQLTFGNEEVWCVVCQVGGDVPPVTILEWRDPQTGRPIPELSSGLVERVARMERDAGRLNDKVLKANAAKLEADRRDSYDKYREIALDVVPHMSALRSSLLPRSQSLRMARDKQRNMGRRI